eukprot:TRINITY_DN28361_c0_g1_i1.p1 TRINITY_DN28361_c0_g1~~TRINITY_DN28361_c0_g1_i1.p1  ORF type:complete len:120 (-),score=13.44 TRINITY_DN28361_c0_g1_i1:27-386(-)
MKQFQFWLEMNSNSYLPIVELQYLFESDSEKTTSNDTGFGKYWTRHPTFNNCVKLFESPLSIGITLLTLGKDADIRRIWDSTTFRLGSCWRRSLVISLVAIETPLWHIVSVGIWPWAKE